MVETSKDAYVVKLSQAHAEVVRAFLARAVGDDEEPSGPAALAVNDVAAWSNAARTKRIARSGSLLE